jgi:hypothetical protein
VWDGGGTKRGGGLLKILSMPSRCTGTEGLPFKNSFDFILTPTPNMFGIGRKLLISRAQKTQHA